MKGSRLYIVFILIFLGITFAIEYHAPKKFTWVPTFSQYDYQPLGCAVFDDVVYATLSAGESPEDSSFTYKVVDNTFYQLSGDTVCNYGILAIAENLSLTETDVETILKMAEYGGKIMLVASTFSQLLEDTLEVENSYSYFDFSALKNYASLAFNRDSLCWPKDSVYPGRIFTFYPQFLKSHFYNIDSLFSILAEKNHAKKMGRAGIDTLSGDGHGRFPVAISKKIGKGEVIMVCTPLLFTNYGMLDGDNAAYIFRLLNRFNGMPVIRTEAYSSAILENESPFRYFFTQAPLRWGLYMTVCVLLLFMIFTARRKQRVIPVIREPENKSIEFTELIGTLYFQKKDLTDLVRKKFIYFAETLRRTAQIDVEEGNNDAELSRRIAQKTGMNEAYIYRLMNNIRPVIQGTIQINEMQMQSYIEQMNEIINHL